MVWFVTKWSEILWPAPKFRKCQNENFTQHQAYIKRWYDLTAHLNWHYFFITFLFVIRHNLSQSQPSLAFRFNFLISCFIFASFFRYFPHWILLCSTQCALVLFLAREGITLTLSTIFMTFFKEIRTELTFTNLGSLVWKQLARNIVVLQIISGKRKATE